MKRLIKKTNDLIYPIGFGAMRLPMKNGKIDRDKSKELIYYGINHGINFIDTAFIYGNGDCEKFLGEILNGYYKDKVLISTKLPIYLINKEEDFEKILNKQLKSLNRENIDYYFLHGIDLKGLRKMEKLNIYDFLKKFQKDGKIKYVGFSYHGQKEKFKEVVDSFNWDVVMVQYNYIDDGVQASIEGIKYAASKNIGVFVMEPLKGGILAGRMPQEIESIFKNKNPNKSNADWALSWILNHEEITCVLSGMNSIEQIKENITIAENIEINSLTSDDIKIFDDVKIAMKNKLKINCATCGYCMPCPRGVNIPEVIKIYNEKYLFNDKKFISESFTSYLTIASGVLTEPAYAGLCNKCGECIRKCPQHLNIPKELKKVSKEFEVPGFKYLLKIVKKIGIPLYKFFTYK